MLCKYEEREGEIREKAVKSSCVIGSLAKVMREMKVKGSLKNIILLLTSASGSETWTWNRTRQSRKKVEIGYLKGECSITRYKDESNESMYE